ncbi:MAG: SLBB domain-containing protein [candidate division KSB1 bacterium]|nr:SLBB domain-containing protein [candidate division KSB1 bacterium]
MRRLYPAFYSVILLAIISSASAQISPGSGQAAAQYFLGDQDQVLMAVNVWGFVNKPGQYMVPLETDLVSLLSYAGGPQEDARIKGIKLVRSIQDSSVVFEIDVNHFVNHGDLDNNPVLRPGDTIVVSGTTFHLISKIFDLTWRVATIVQAVYFAQWYSQRD